MDESEVEELKNKFLKKNSNYYEVEKLEEADNYLAIYMDGKKRIPFMGLVQWDTTEETIELEKKKKKVDKVYYLKNTKIKKRKKSKREQAKIEKFKENIIKDIPDLIEVEEMENADSVLIIHNDFTQWDVIKNDEPSPRFVEHIKDVFDLSVYWLKRKNQQDDIEKILDYIKKEVRRKR